MDEVGRGCLAGPVYVAAVILPADAVILGLNDSKKLSAKKREALAEIIEETAMSYAIGSASVAEIDALNILGATRLAMRRAIEGLSVQPDYILADYMPYPDCPYRADFIPKGDCSVNVIAAASILAKVKRDQLMCSFEDQYPGYDLAKNKGYPTPKHYEGLERLGPSEIHRKTYLKKWLAGRVDKG